MVYWRGIVGPVAYWWEDDLQAVALVVLKLQVAWQDVILRAQPAGPVAVVQLLLYFLDHKIGLLPQLDILL